MTPTGWRLTVEPFSDAIGWSLLRNDGRTELVDAGRHPAVEVVRGLVYEMCPNTTAAPRSDGCAGLWASTLSDPDSELLTAVTLGKALLPNRLREALLSTRPDVENTVTIATRGWLAGVPWDLLALDDDGRVRLMERAVVLGGLSPVVDGTRARVSEPMSYDAPGCAIVDPGPIQGASGSLYPSGYPSRLIDRFDRHEDIYTQADRGADPDQVAFALNQRPARLLYLGHIRGAPADHQRFAALVLRGSSLSTPAFLTSRDWLADPHRWPAPPRVALIGCASDDTSSFEQTGLVIAAVNAGAHLVTATRWPLPADHPAPRTLTPTQPVNHEVLTDLAVAVHSAHTQPRPANHLRQWQLRRLDHWRRTRDRADSPLCWAGVITYLTAPRKPLR